jgi:hypothetical protein
VFAGDLAWAEMAMTANIVVDTDSIDSAADLLRGIAADMAVGQFDLFLMDWVGMPGCPREMAKAMRVFAELAHDRYRDTASLAAQLSVHLAMAAANYRLRDVELAQKMTRPLAGFVPRQAGL